MNLTTRYDVEMRRIGVANRDTFIQNLEILSDISENARKLLDELNAMKKEIMDVEAGLEKQEMLDKLDSYYCCINSIHIIGVYNIIIVKFNYKRDKNITVTNFDNAKSIIYDAYKQDRHKFIECMHEWRTSPDKWMYYFKEEHIKENKFDGQEKRCNAKIPEVPYIPF